MKHLPALATMSLIGLVGMPAMSQSRTEKVSQIASALSGAVDDDNAQYVNAKTGEPVRATPRQLMRETMTNVDYDALPAKLALEVWSQQTGVPMVVNWARLEAAGIDPSTPVTLKLRRVPADQVLKLIVQQIHPDPIADDKLMLDIQQWYVRVVTREDLLRRGVTRIYFIGDLLMTVPNFKNAPNFDLNSALSNTSSGGSNGGGGGGASTGLFGTTEVEEEREPSKQEKADNIADVVRNSIEPDIWRANGGEYGSIQYLRGMLVIKAPQFVHDQIGVPFDNNSNTRKSTTRAQSKYRSEDNSSGSTTHRRRSTSGNVAGVAPRRSNPVR